MSTGFNFGTATTTQTATGGFNVGSFGQAAAKPASGATGLTAPGFGAAGAGGGGGGFTFGGGTTGVAGTTGLGTTPAAAVPAAAAATPATTAATAGFGGFGAPAAKTTSSGGLVGFGTTTTAPAVGLTLGAAKTTAAAATTATTTSAASTGFGFGTGGLLGAAATAKPAQTFKSFGATTTTTTSSGFSLGGGLGGSSLTASTAAGSSLFAAPTTTTASKGLGGLDPKTTTTTTGTAGVNGKPSDAKAVKETAMPNEITVTVEDFKKYVKEQRNIREDIDRMSSKQMYKVQEEVASLKQLLSLVSTGLQRNAVAIDKLKQESAQELKNAEIAQRTKDLPPGLQYEHTAPSEYFARMVEDFECRMVLYRQQIEEMESHLASLQQPAMLTPQELSLLLKKIYESFIHLAAQLQVIHEAVKAQKDQYLNYRKVFHGDTTDVFEKRRKAADKAKNARPERTVGPTPFTGMSNAAALAMATALNRSQQPTGAAAAAGTLGLNPGLGSSTLGAQTGGLGTGLGAGSLFGGTSTTGGLGTGFGSTGFGSTAQQTQQSSFGSSSFNFGASNTAAVRPLGSTFGSTGSSTTGGLFGSSAPPAPQTGFGFGSTQAPVAGGGAGGTGFNLAGAAAPAFGAPAADNKQPFLLQKPPAGNKKGKKT